MKKEYLIYKLSEDLKEATRIENELFKKFDVKRGLRIGWICSPSISLGRFMNKRAGAFNGKYKYPLTTRPYV